MPAATQTSYWNRYVDAGGSWRRDARSGPHAVATPPPGEDLAALRSGLGRPAGSVPALWRFYTCEVDDYAARRGEVSDEQEAEHAALALFGLHQQGQQDPMHRPGVSLGRALRALRQSGKFSEEAVDRRVQAVAATTSVPALLHRLRGLVDQMRTIHQPLDYDLLMQDVRNWHRPDARQRVRRTWGLHYHVWDQASS